MCFLHLQEDNGLPVHIKGGTGDVLLYRATMTLTIAGEERCSRCISVVQEDKARISDRNKACVETAQTFTDVSSVSVSRVQHEHQTPDLFQPDSSVMGSSGPSRCSYHLRSCL